MSLVLYIFCPFFKSVISVGQGRDAERDDGYHSEHEVAGDARGDPAGRGAVRVPSRQREGWNVERKCQFTSSV